jgi:hypothetical protein
VKRRYAVLDKLRDEYILEQPASSGAMLEKKEYPPVQWINDRLKALGESWRFEDRDHPFTVSEYEAMTNQELKIATVEFASKLGQFNAGWKEDDQTARNLEDAALRALQSISRVPFGGKIP